MEKKEQSAPSEEVIGVLTEPQQQTYAFLASVIAKAEGLEATNPDHIDRIRTVIDDSIGRGLKERGRIWFKPDEDISGVFNHGLSLRKALIDKARSVLDIYHNGYLTPDEREVLSQEMSGLSPLSADISAADKAIHAVTESQQAVISFKSLLLNQSEVALEAAQLRAIASNSIAYEGIKLTPGEIDDMIICNILINRALYPSKGELSLEGEDIALLASLWKDTSARDSGNQRLVEEMQLLAQKLGVNYSAIGIYIEQQLLQINIFISKGEITETDLIKAPPFILTPENVRAQMETSHSRPERVYSPTQEEERLASGKFEKSLELFASWELASKEIEESDLDEDTKATEISNNLTHLLQSLNGYEVVYLLDQIDERSDEIPEAFLRDFIQEDLFIGSTDSFVDAVTVAYYDKVGGIDDKYLSIIREKIVTVVKQAIASNRLNLNRLTEFPHEFIADLIEEGDLSEEAEAILTDNLDVEEWIDISKQMGAEYISDNSSLEVDNIVVFGGADRLINYLTAMPVGKREKIIEGIKNVVEF